MNFGDEQDRSSFPSDDLAAQCAFGLSCLGGAEASLASLGGTRSKPRRR